MIHGILSLCFAYAMFSIAPNRFLTADPFHGLKARLPEKVDSVPKTFVALIPLHRILSSIYDLLRKGTADTP